MHAALSTVIPQHSSAADGGVGKARGLEEKLPQATSGPQDAPD